MKKLDWMKGAAGLALSGYVLLGWQNDLVFAQNATVGSQAKNQGQTSQQSTSQGAPQSSTQVPSQAASPQLTGSAQQVDEIAKPAPISPEQVQKFHAGIASRYKDGWSMFLQNPLHTGVFE
ncbi:hypothetical protein U6J25_12065, partial [Cutibacterium acnes]